MTTTETCKHTVNLKNVEGREGRKKVRKGVTGRGPDSECRATASLLAAGLEDVIVSFLGQVVAPRVRRISEDGQGMFHSLDKAYRASAGADVELTRITRDRLTLENKYGKGFFAEGRSSGIVSRRRRQGRRKERTRRLRENLEDLLRGDSSFCNDHGVRDVGRLSTAELDQNKEKIQPAKERPRPKLTSTPISGVSTASSAPSEWHCNRKRRMNLRKLFLSPVADTYTPTTMLLADAIGHHHKNFVGLAGGCQSVRERLLAHFSRSHPAQDDFEEKLRMQIFAPRTELHKTRNERVDSSSWRLDDIMKKGHKEENTLRSGRRGLLQKNFALPRRNEKSCTVESRQTEGKVPVRTDDLFTDLFLNTEGDPNLGGLIKHGGFSSAFTAASHRDENVCYGPQDFHGSFRNSYHDFFSKNLPEARTSRPSASSVVHQCGQSFPTRQSPTLF